MSAIAAAARYIEMGYQPVPIAPRDKRPVDDGWQKRTFVPADFAPDGNIGLKLGDPSGGLVDVDCDCPEAVELAPLYLPRTPVVTGRDGRPKSHYWYISPCSQTRQFRDPQTRKMIVELRSTGGQTLIGPSQHPEGGRYDDLQGSPAIISFDDLLASVQELHRACLVKRYGAAKARKLLEPKKPPAPPQANLPDSWTDVPMEQRERRAAAYIDKYPPAISGQGGHPATYALAVAIVHGFAIDEERALGLLLQHYNPRCQPEWAEHELRHKVNDAANKPHDKPYGYLLMESADRLNGRPYGHHTDYVPRDTAGSQPGKPEGAGNAQGPVPICNFEEREGPEGKPVYDPLPMSSIITRIRQRCDDWPRRCGSALFVHDTNGLDWLDSPPALFGWLQSRTGIVEWKRGSGYVTKEELHSELRRTATEYAAVESFPHEPPMAGHYYACQAPEPGAGSALAGLLDRFSPETEIDRDLIQAFGMTLVWGGRSGARPAFVLTSDAGRGVGKTTIPAVFGHLLGGLIDFAAGDKIGDIKARLLSAEAATKRLALLDNVKSLRFSWAELEALITAPLISGRRLYVGEASRPNLLTWAITVNGASLATDLAQRAVIIKLRKPEHSARWQEETFDYVDQHRDRIIADLIGCLQAERGELRQASRWGSWEWDVLARLPEPNEAAKVIAERREAVDVEAEESSIVEEYFEQQIIALHYEDSDRVFVPSRVAAKWWSEAIGDRGATVTAAVRQLKQKIDEGCIRRLAVSPSRTHGRGFVWTGTSTSLDTSMLYDIESRIEYQITRCGT